MRATRIAAIFDVDGTLIANDSLERIFIKFLWRSGELGARDITRLASGAIRALAEGHSPLKANKAYLRGKPANRVERLARDCFAQEIARRLLPSALERLRWHQRAGHGVILLSGTLDLLLTPLAEYLGVHARIGAELEVADGCLTGRLVGRHPFGAAKAASLMARNSAGAFDLARSFAYADHYADRYLLAAVGHPIAANPDRRLRRLAEGRGWMIEDFTAADRELILPQNHHC
jgi:putative phosphoserine phosphatase/1-acylglycerol-3-phosphate O-acyltransferase